MSEDSSAPVSFGCVYFINKLKKLTILAFAICAPPRAISLAHPAMFVESP
jgi:hypothetical protein